MRSNRIGSLRSAFAGLGAFLALMLLGATSATAGVGGSVIPGFPATLNVGQTLSSTVTITNNSTSPNQTENVNVSGIFFTPSCASDDGFTCFTPDPGVYQFGTAIGKAGSSCAGTVFTVGPPNAGTGEVQLIPNKQVVLGPSSGAGPLSKQCVITIGMKVLRLPQDSTPPGAPITTDALARASMQGASSGNSGAASGGSQSIITAPNLAITKNPKGQTINAGDVATFTIVVDNSTGTGAAFNVQLNDTLPNVAGLNWQLNPPVAGCSVTGSNPQVLSCTGLNVPAGGTATLVVSATTSPLACVQMTNTATITGTNSLTLSLPISDTGSITCMQTPGINKAFFPLTFTVGGTTTLTFTITNPAANNPAQVVSFTDTLPTKLQVAGTPNVVNNCTGGTVTANAGASSITVANTTVGASGASAATCTISVDVTNVPLQVGTCPDANLTNTSANLSGLVNLNNNVTASCVTVTQQQPGINKAFSPTTINSGGITTLTFTITNPAAFNPAQTFSYTDTLPTKLQVAGTPNVVNGCTGGTVTATAGSSTIAISGAQVGASGASATTCTISVDVTNVPLQFGTCPDANLTNTSSNLSGLVNIVNNVTPSCVTVIQPCDLTLTKTCSLSPVTAYSCSSNPITTLKMSWAGSGSIYVQTPTVASPNPAIQGPFTAGQLVQNNVAYASADRTNGTAVWNIYSDAAGTNQIGQSKFSLNCTDPGMNSADDCFLPEGDLSGSTTCTVGGVPGQPCTNTWLLELIGGATTSLNLDCNALADNSGQPEAGCVVPSGGGLVNYHYTVTNNTTAPAVVTVTDDKIPGMTLGPITISAGNDAVMSTSDTTLGGPGPQTITQVTKNTGTAHGNASGGVDQCSATGQAIVVPSCFLGDPAKQKPYPYSASTCPTCTAGPFTNTAFNESTVLKASEPTVATSGDSVRMYYSDEHALSLGISSVTASGTCIQAHLPPGQVCPVTGTFTVTPFPTTAAGMTALGAPSGTLALSAGFKKDNVTSVLPYFLTASDQRANLPNNPSGGTALTLATGANTCPSGCDPSMRPVAPALFCTDITNVNTNKGDWQIIGGTGHPPEFVSGTWKAATSTVTCSDNGTVTTCAPVTTVGADPQANVTTINPAVWNAGPYGQAPIGGSYNVLNTTTSVKLEAYGAQISWNVENQILTCIDGATGNPTPGFQSGHVYRVQMLVHDGDQNKSGGDSGESCATIAVP